MSRFEVTRWHIGCAARVRIEPRELSDLQLRWLRFAAEPGGRRMGEIGDLLAQTELVSSELGHAIAWTLYESLYSRGLADLNAQPNEQLRFYATTDGRVLVEAAEREHPLRRTA